ncbi:MAG: 3-oxoadipyl-CoA thiolase [Rhodobacteraceae bacterium]|nr:3-oxoadipyl-CoA thiolase [Paracoccaceae bacterium]MYF46847.1 3-oxoadipyl-CoA thiolase [Paracoccaceae bacterium]MYI92701.1 3-oxoadipyl-CoA thiolase [Paracoccaceae bacterium]
MTEVFICSYHRTPIGRFGGSLSSIRPDDLCALTLKQILEKNPDLDYTRVDEVIIGCANQAGEDNRNVARMGLLLAGYPHTVPGTTVNRLCGSGMDAILIGARQIKANEADLVVAGGTESMSRAPFVLPKSSQAFGRNAEIYDTTIGWRFVNPVMKELYGTDSMPETAENVAEDFNISREDQDKFALWSQQKASKSGEKDYLKDEIIPVSVPQRKGDPLVISSDEHPRQTSLEKLSSLPTPFRSGGTVTAGNSSGVNDGAAALLLASERAIDEFKLNPIARIVGGSTIGVEPRIMGIGPAYAINRLCRKFKLDLEKCDILEINEAFASQSLATTRYLNLEDDDPRINPNGGAIAYGHPLGMSGTRITGIAALEMFHQKKKNAIAAMCIGVGQGIAIALKAV